MCGNPPTDRLLFFLEAHRAVVRAGLQQRQPRDHYKKNPGGGLKNPRRGTFAPNRNRTLEAQNITQKDSRVVQEDSAAELNSKRLPGCAGRLGTHQPNSHDTVQQATPVWRSGFPRNFLRKSVILVVKPTARVCRRVGSVGALTGEFRGRTGWLGGTPDWGISGADGLARWDP